MTYSPALPAAMGYSVKMDEPAGYGVVRMLAVKDGTTQVWNPREDSAQCFEVLCWFMRKAAAYTIEDGEIWTPGNYTTHDNTPASLRAAIVEAAERVANG